VVAGSGEFFGLLLEYSIRKIFGKDLLGEAENDSVFDCVFQFANISGPAVAYEESAGFA